MLKRNKKSNICLIRNKLLQPKAFHKNSTTNRLTDFIKQLGFDSWFQKSCIWFQYHGHLKSILELLKNNGLSWSICFHLDRKKLWRKPVHKTERTQAISEYIHACSAWKRLAITLISTQHVLNNQHILPFCVSLVEQRKDVIQKDSLVVFTAWLLFPTDIPFEKGSLR